MFDLYFFFSEGCDASIEKKYKIYSMTPSSLYDMGKGGGIVPI